MPVFAVGGWYDNYVESDLEAFAALHNGSGSGFPAPHSDRPVGAQHVHAVSGSQVRRRTPLRPSARISSNGSITGSRERPKTPARYSPSAWHVARSKWTSAGAHLRHGREPLARRTGMAAGAHALHAAVSGEPGPRQHSEWRRRAGMEGSSARSSPTGSPTILATRCRRAAARCAAIRRFFRGDRWTSVRWKSAPTCWSTPARR